MADIIEQSRDALRDLSGLVPQEDRERYAVDHIRVLERTIILLSEALQFQATLLAHSERLNSTRAIYELMNAEEGLE